MKLIFSIPIAVLLIACGARTPLEDLSSRDSAPSLDAGVPPPRCNRLSEPSTILRVFDDRVTGRPLIVARLGAFDVLAGMSAADERYGYRVRRLSRDGALGAEAHVGPEARGVGSLAVNGDRLGFCYGARDLEGPTRFVVLSGVAYEDIQRNTIGSDAGDHCVSLSGARARPAWLALWNHRLPAAFGYAVAELDDMGGLSTSPRDVGSIPAATTALGDGWVVTSIEGGEPVVTFRAGDGSERAHRLGGLLPANIESMDVIASPFADDAVEVAVEGRPGTPGLVFRLRGDGTVEAETTIVAPETDLSSAVSLGQIANSTVFARGSCHAVDEAGDIQVTLRDADGGIEHELAIARSTCPSFPRLARLDTTLAVAWQEGDGGVQRTHVALLECLP